MKTNKRQQKFNIYLNKILIDTVYANPLYSYTASEMKDSLVNHDHYNPGIVVIKSKE
jgi:fructose-1,6-bisphosphatase